MREQMAPSTAGYQGIQSRFTDAVGAAVDGRKSGSPREVQGSGLNYSGGVANRSAPRFAGENRQAIALLGMDGDRSFHEATMDKKNKPAMRYLGDLADQILNARDAGMYQV